MSEPARGSEKGGARRWLASDEGIHPAPWVALFVTLVLVHEALLARARPLAPREWAYMEAATLAQCVFIVASFVIVASSAGRFRSALIGLASILPALFYVDSLVAERADLHLPALAKLSFDAAVTDDWRTFLATGLSPRALANTLGGLALLGLGGAWLYGRAASTPEKRRWRVTRGRVVGAWWVAAVVLAVLEASAGYAMTSASWTRVARAAPQVLGALGPQRHAKATVRATLRPLASDAAVDDAVARLTMPAEPPPGDVFLFVLESFRTDAVDPALTPTLASLVAGGLHAETTVAGGNVTHYAWYSLFESQSSLHWRYHRGPDDAHGAATSIRVARRRGWRVEALVSADLAYNHMDTMLFGTSEAAAESAVSFASRPGSNADHDVDVMRELAARVARPHDPTVFIVALDATHFIYAWGPGFTPPRVPYADAGYYYRSETTPEERREVANRYYDAAAFDDSLLGAFVAQLRAAGTYDDSTLVLLGDHGEELWDHGFSAHGSEPCSIQAHVPFAILPSRRLRGDADWSTVRPLATAVDVWPTIFDAAGVRGDLSALFTGRSLLREPSLPGVTGSNRSFSGPGWFSIDDGRRRVELAWSDPDHPDARQALNVLDFFDEHDEPTDDDATPERYVARLRARFGATLDRDFVVEW